MIMSKFHIENIFGDGQHHVHCVSFNEFKQIAYTNEWENSVHDNIAIISINNSKHCSAPGEYHICRDAYNVLNLNFDDVDPVAYGLSDNAISYTYEDVNNSNEYITVDFFNSKMAERVVDFIERNKEKNFVIHCSAGISRSQAFVKYIINVYSNEYDWETNPNNPCIHPNGFVYSKLMEVYRKVNIKN
jgi:hypothetical protein